jgi:cytochrome b561
MPAPRHSAAAILLHRLMAALFVAAYATIEMREFFPRGSDPREVMKAWHYALGVSIFGLVWARLLLRLFSPTPHGDQPRWQAWASGLVHVALYLLMIALPLLGWLALSAEGEHVVWLGLELPAITAPNEGLAEQSEELHETIGKAGYFLIGVHTAAALLHHYLLKDRVMARMLPPRRGAA